MSSESNILIVDDNLQIQSLLAELLSIAGHTTESASTCEEARDLLDSHAFCCALIDLGLPDGNGLDLLPAIRGNHPFLVPIILTGDGRAETIIETMRAGAFDFLIKPFVSATLQAAVNRALDYHKVLRERDELVHLLSEEREQLKARVAEATQDIRQYASHCELVSSRLHSLVRLTQVASERYSDELVFRSVAEELENYFPLRCVVLQSVTGSELLFARRDGGVGDIGVIVVEGAAPSGADGGHSHDNGEAEARLRMMAARHAAVASEGAALYIYPQSYWGKKACTVGFFLDDGFEVDSDCDQFLSMCAHFLGFEWQDARLSLHATQQASLGNIAVEISKGLIQGLTAIRTTTDYVIETSVSPEALEGLNHIRGSVDSLHNQINDFRQLSQPQKDSVETVHLSAYLNQAVEMLGHALQNRGIAVERHYEGDSPCVLLNGKSLARTFLDLISASVRAVDVGGTIALSLTEAESNHVLVEINHEMGHAELFGIEAPGDEDQGTLMIESHPQFILAQRTVQRCGGRLMLKCDDDSHRAFHIILPRNPLANGGRGEGVG